MPFAARRFLPILAATLALAGCQTPPPATSPEGTAHARQAEAQPARASRVEFFIADTQPAAGRTELQVPDGVLYLERQPVLTRADLSEAAALVGRDGQAFLGLRFNDDGARKLRDATMRHAGKLLALVVDRELITAPAIAEPLDRGVMTLAMPTTEAAGELAARIRGNAAGPR